MGRRTHFVCGECGYDAMVSGAQDIGFVAAVVTVSCAECRRLYDATTAVAMFDPAEHERAQPDSPWHLEHVPPIAPTEWTRVVPRCPVDRTHHIEPWTAPGPCPRCGATMEPVYDVIVHWD